jgi:hypothetical protein
MKAVNNKVLVSVNMEQKDTMIIGDVEYKAALSFEVNHREKSPVIAKVIRDVNNLFKGDILICHHNMFTQTAYFVADNVFSIPLSNVLFAKLYSDGSIYPIYGNMICEKIPLDDKFIFTGEDTKKERVYQNRYKVVIPGLAPYKENQIIFTRPHSGYDIVYNVGGKVNRITKVDSQMVCGVIM